ncbi:hypothetical protein B1A75_16510 [Geobacillus sp. LEMMY01]|nr:hypothetical protein B1A75_16510 [Geobacillus sp. LEMMY01]
MPPSRLGVTDDRTTTCFSDPYMGLKAVLFGLPTVDPMLSKSYKCENFKLHLYSTTGCKCMLADLLIYG